MTSTRIVAVEYHLPQSRLGNENLEGIFPEWPATQIESKLGITGRRIASPNECSSDLAVNAALKLFDSNVASREDIEFVLFCTQTPDYFLPTTACLIQDRLSLKNSTGALDFNLGCSAYVYGLGLSKGIIETGQARTVLLLTGETYSKLLLDRDKSTRTLFGDAGTATLLTSAEGTESEIGPFVYGTDGSGGEHLIVEKGAFRNQSPSTLESRFLQMNGGEVFTFGVKQVHAAVDSLLAKSNKEIGDIDLFIFHQANTYMLEFLRKKCAIPQDKFYIHIKEVGNTVSNTIPIALHCAIKDKVVSRGAVVMLVGFGVGFSWGACVVKL